jgi:hypothetical protein
LIDHLLPSCTDTAARTHPEPRPQTRCAGRTKGAALHPDVVTMPALDGSESRSSGTAAIKSRWSRKKID